MKRYTIILTTDVRFTYAD